MNWKAALKNRTALIIGAVIFFIILFMSRGGQKQSSMIYAGVAQPSDASIASVTDLEKTKVLALSQIEIAKLASATEIHSSDTEAATQMQSLAFQRELGLAEISANERTSFIESTNNLAGEQAKATAQVNINSSNRKADNVKSIGAVIGGIAKGLMSIFSDQRTKENIVHVGFDRRDNRLFQYNYKGSNRVYRGYLAQELINNHPDKVIIDNATGLMKVLM
jgi:hypothetical protein